MSEKIRDNKNRWRWKTVGFRVSPEEWEHFEKIVSLTGLKKQDFLIKSILNRDIVVNGNPRVAKALKDELAYVLTELRRIKADEGVDSELLDLITFIVKIIDKLHSEERVKKYTFK